MGTHIKNTFASTKFGTIEPDNQAKVHYVIRRKYIPMGFMNKGEVLGTPTMKAAYTAGNRIR
ncbi:hypothetical protein HMP0721_2461 [Pseudoramibacter alactolyticus ATCC 23263]|uniref:Uncharacterized protein n=1 Tax=Pseudoramibacter alactolyticus ATCC 23263 TaxID=887929 RepID=E6MKC5_9FIRM|nr:hypothetical protein HMP0721_2461 [Pseudoramibacter alactolyticus ATCC 23263]